MSDLTEQHFILMIALMLLFFGVDIGLEVLQGIKIVALPSAIATAHDGYIAFFGVAIGIFRGMVAQGSAIDQSNRAVTSVVTTDVHSEKTVPATEPPVQP